MSVRFRDTNIIFCNFWLMFVCDGAARLCQTTGQLKSNGSEHIKDRNSDPSGSDQQEATQQHLTWIKLGSSSQLIQLMKLDCFFWLLRVFFENRSELFCQSWAENDAVRRYQILSHSLVKTLNWSAYGVVKLYCKSHCKTLKTFIIDSICHRFE